MLVWGTNYQSKQIFRTYHGSLVLKKKMRIALLPIRSRFSKTQGFEVLRKRHYANISNYYCKLAGVWDIYFLLFNHPNEAKYPRDMESTVIMPNGYQESQCRCCERSRSNHIVYFYCWNSIRPHSASCFICSIPHLQQGSGATVLKTYSSAMCAAEQAAFSSLTDE